MVSDCGYYLLDPLLERHYHISIRQQQTSLHLQYITPLLLNVLGLQSQHLLDVRILTV